CAISASAPPSTMSRRVGIRDLLQRAAVWTLFLGVHLGIDRFFARCPGPRRQVHWLFALDRLGGVGLTRRHLLPLRKLGPSGGPPRTKRARAAGAARAKGDGAARSDRPVQADRLPLL